MDRGAWRPTVHGVAKSQTQLSDRERMHLSLLRSAGGKVQRLSWSAGWGGHGEGQGRGAGLTPGLARRVTEPTWSWDPRAERLVKVSSTRLHSVCRATLGDVCFSSTSVLSSTEVHCLPWRGCLCFQGTACGYTVGRSELSTLDLCTRSPVFLFSQGSLLSFSPHPRSKSHGRVVCLTQALWLFWGQHTRGESAHLGPEVELPQVLWVEMAHNRCGVTAHRKQWGKTWGTTRNGANCQENSDPQVLGIALSLPSILGELPFATI